MLYKAISDKILYHLSVNSKVNMDYRDIYAYALEKYITALFNIVIFSFIAIVLQIQGEAIAFFLFYGPLRKYAGGLHLKTRTGCLILSLLIMVAVIKLAKLIASTDYWVGLSLIGLLIAIFLVYRFAPVDCENKRLSEETKRLHRKRAVRILVIDSLVILTGLMFLPIPGIYIVIPVMGLLLEGIFLILNKLTEGK